MNQSEVEAKSIKQMLGAGKPEMPSTRKPETGAKRGKT